MALSSAKATGERLRMVYGRPRESVANVDFPSVQINSTDIKMREAGQPPPLVGDISAISLRNLFFILHFPFNICAQSLAYSFKRQSYSLQWKV